MDKMLDDFEKLERNFHGLIIEKSKFCQIDKFLEENPDFELPKITENWRGEDLGYYSRVTD